MFVLSAYFAGARVSILASHPVYHWIRHGPGENALVARCGRPIERRMVLSCLWMVGNGSARVARAAETDVRGA